MGIYNALYTGSSGLSAFGESVRIIGDNIANINSLGFKSQNVVFSDVLSQTVGVTRSNIANQVGNGVRIGQITRDQQQGSIQNTTSPTDMAINGNGMFALKDPANDQTFYTRAGSFFLDKDSNLIDGQGFVVQGWQTDATDKATGNITDITFGGLSSQAAATTKVTAGVSLDSNAIPFPNGTIFDPADTGTYHYKSELNIYDSLGNTHAVSIHYSKLGLDATGQTVWDWHASVDGGEIGGAAGAPLEIGAPTASQVTPNIGVGAYTAGTNLSITAVSQVSNINGVNASYTFDMDAGGNVTVKDAQGISQAVIAAGTLTAGATTPITLTNGAVIGITVAGGGLTVAAGTNVGGSLAVTGADPGVVTTLGTQTLVFNAAGALNTEAAPNLAIPWNNAAASSISMNFGNALTADQQGITGDGLDGAVQMAGSYATRQVTRDGYSAGFLDKLETDSTGRIFGVFTNGQRRSLYQVALAKFPNDAVLNHVGNNLQQETISSGSPILEKPGNGGMGSITPYGLEQSNVDLAGEFVKLIVVQRGYEANSKTISTTDQMLSSLMQLKR
ncbi:MAG: flagellar hook-basal body complex protein [Ghiorsea sp.]